MSTSTSSFSAFRSGPGRSAEGNDAASQTASPAGSGGIASSPAGNSAGNTSGAAAAVNETRKLTVGRDISLSGEINACDQLIVEGTVEAAVRDASTIEIAPTGLFRGTIAIRDADIAGRFEGDLEVSGRLRVRSTGQINGSVSYGELEVEVGGILNGTLKSLGEEARKEAPKFSSASSSTGSATPSSANEDTLSGKDGEKATGKDAGKDDDSKDTSQSTLMDLGNEKKAVAS